MMNHSEIANAILLCKKLSFPEKAILQFLALNTDGSGCTLSNEYIGGIFELSKERVSRIISSLKGKGHLKLSVKPGLERVILPILPLTKTSIPIDENVNTPLTKTSTPPPPLDENVNTHTYININNNNESVARGNSGTHTHSLNTHTKINEAAKELQQTKAVQTQVGQIQEQLNPLPTNSKVQNSKGGGKKAAAVIERPHTEEELAAAMEKYKAQYGAEMITGFLNYWTEKNKYGKCRFQVQEFFEIPKRLATWKKMETPSYGKKAAPVQEVIYKKLGPI
jgi:hypothetical protein